MKDDLYYTGNKELLECNKTAFLCSRKIPAEAVLKCYDWAIEQRDAGKCVISGFHSRLEKDVLHYLLKGVQPIIVALARGLKQRIEPDFKRLLDEGRLLIVTPFEANVKRVTEETAVLRNKVMIELANDIVVGYANEKGRLSETLSEIIESKSVIYLHK